MTELIWNEGMSVGIDAIDEDHKQIIAILAKLTSAEHGETSAQTINAIFTELEHYVSLHFAREEALLEQVCYAEITAHKASHQNFIEQLPALKHEWLAEDCLACSEKITTFLHQWIVKHILVEDLDYVATIDKFSNVATKQKDKNQSKFSVDIDKLKTLTDELTASFNRKIQLESQRLEQNYYVILILLSIFLVSATLFSLILNHSIINPVRRITQAGIEQYGSRS